MDKIEAIIEIVANKWETSDIVHAWNLMLEHKAIKCKIFPMLPPEARCKIFPMSSFNEMFGTKSHLEVIKMVHNCQFGVDDDYFSFNAEGYIESFSDINDFSAFSYYDLADYLADKGDSLTKEVDSDEEIMLLEEQDDNELEEIYIESQVVHQNPYIYYTFLKDCVDRIEKKEYQDKLEALKNSNIFNMFSEKIDVWTLNVYNVILMTAPDSEFNNWQSILDNCLSSLEFSDTFVNEFNKEESNILSTIQANQKVYNEISDMIMDSWEKRNNSYDIISQKQSDATLGYERVYDTDTGEIYKAYNGFTDDYDGTKYQPITDDMYTESISGTIEK